MKSILKSGFVLALLSAMLILPLHGQNTAVRHILDIKADELAPQLTPFVLDLPNDDTPTPHCRNLYGYVCSSTTKSDNKRDNLERQLNTDFWDKLSQRPSSVEFNEISRGSLQSAEDAVYELTGITRDELRIVLSYAKAEIIAYLSGTEGRRLFPSDAAGQEQLQRLISKLETVQLRYGQEYIDDLAMLMQSLNEEMSFHVLKARAYNQYHSRCGGNGLTVNAFSSPAFEPVGNNTVVLCPGLIISISDHDTNKEEMLAAVHFVMGQELGRFIGADMADAWNLYSKMGACYEQEIGLDWSNSPAVAGQISSDFWGSYVLAKRLENIESLQQRAKVTALALDALCTETAKPELQAVGIFRIQQVIGRHPLLATQLSCPLPSEDRPFCSLNGGIPVSMQ